MPQVEINGIKINYVFEGTGFETIAFIHGLGESLESWRNQINFFSKKFKVVALDLRGHGKSSIPKKRIEIGDFAEDVKGLLDHLGIKKAHFCGLSMGALVLFEMYKRYPDYFLSMILVASRHKFPPAQTAVLEGMSMEIIGAEVATFALAANAPEQLKEEVAKMIAGTKKDVYIQSAEATSMLDYSELLPKIKVPTLIIVGDLDIVTPVSSAETINKSIKGSILQIIPSVGHLPNREAPEKFNNLLEEFLQKISLGGKKNG
ncbi:MAG: alpha/beta fold hydrolase [Candidatus Bathyarchaeia archaeon]